MLVMNPSVASSATLPVLFVGHGNPMHSITANPWRRAWQALGNSLPRPRAVLCVSAHWETPEPAVCDAPQPQTIHDFGGFPPELFAQQYPAPGAPWLAQAVRALADSAATAPEAPRAEDSAKACPAVRLRSDWGLDHGAWAVLMALFPRADVPVAQLSLGRSCSPQQHFALGRALASLRDNGVMLVCSGNITHNLRALGAGLPPAWAVDVDEAVAQALQARRWDALIQPERLGVSPQALAMAVPTAEHYLPLLYAAAWARDTDALNFPVQGFDLGSISMRSAIWRHSR